jgi:hypothetical protein
MVELPEGDKPARGFVGLAGRPLVPAPLRSGDLDSLKQIISSLQIQLRRVHEQMKLIEQRSESEA